MFSPTEISEILTAVDKGPNTIVAIDGPSAAGKSTLADELAQACGGVVIHMDDFYRPMDESERAALSPGEGINNYFDWQRLRDQALIPLHAGERATFEVYDWVANQCSNSESVAPAKITFVEGVYSGRRELSKWITALIYVDAPAAVRRDRQALRGESSREWRERWAQAERLYFKRHRVRARADIVVSGNRSAT